MVKGFVMDDKRHKNQDGRPDYFDELLARVRNVRASEKRFFQKVRDCLPLAVIMMAAIKPLKSYMQKHKTKYYLPLRAKKQPK